jgi:phosphoribosylformylglycinamidine cyclo-ligase
LSLLYAKRYPLSAKITGISHITGGAFYDKIARILPADINVRIYKDSWPVPKIFRLIQDKGNIQGKEMYHTFNMGVGMALIAKPESAKAIVAKLSALKLKSWIIGEAVKGKRKVQIA